VIQVSVGGIKSTVSGYLSVAQDQSLVDCGRRWFELDRDGVLYSFTRLTVSQPSYTADSGSVGQWVIGQMGSPVLGGSYGTRVAVFDPPLTYDKIHDLYTK